jgi:hypothetical protein
MLCFKARMHADRASGGADGVAEWRKNLDLKAWGDEVRAVEKS